MKKLLVLSVYLLFTINLISALDCQYPQQKELNLSGINIWEQKTLEEINLSELIEVKFVGKLIMRIKNSLDIPIKLQILYSMESSWFGGHDSNITIDIGAYDEYTYKDPSEDSCVGYPCGLKNLKIYYLEPTEISLETCKLCNGKTCLDDGISCQKNSECGSSFCVRNVCSHSNLCYNNDCKCSADEIQCNDNQRCVKKGVVPTNVKPECNKYQECSTQYIDLKTGLCAKSPEQLSEEENKMLKEEMDRKEKQQKFLIQAIIGIAFIVLFGTLAVWYLKNEHEKKKQRTIMTKADSEIKIEEQKQRTMQKAIELEAKKIQTKEYELNELKNQIKEIEKQKHKTKQETKELENLVLELKNKKREVENLRLEYEKFISEKLEMYNKPFPDPQVNNHLVVKNPYLGMYKCFYQKDMPLDKYSAKHLVHRWVWMKHNGRYPKQGYHIHHNDGNKYNNDPKNLKEREGAEHYESHKNDFKKQELDI